MAKVLDELESISARLEITDRIAKLLKKTPKNEIKKAMYILQGVVAPAFTGIEIGMGDKLVEQSIALVSGLSKEKVEKNYMKSGDLGKTAEEVLKKKKQLSLGFQKLTLGKVYDNFYKISQMQGTGTVNARVKLLAELLSNASPVEAKVIVRFATGSLRVGAGGQTLIDAMSFSIVGDKSLSKIIERAYNMRSDLGLIAEILYNKGANQLKKIGPMPFYPIRSALAERLPTAKEIIERLGKCEVEEKYDGFRLQCHKKGSRVELYSRSQEKMTHMFPDVVEVIKKQVKAKECILEGEAIGYDEITEQFMPFQLTIQRKRKYEINEKIKEIPLTLFAFDIMYKDGKDYTLEPFKKRRATLERTVVEGKGIKLARRIIAKTPEELEKFFNECITNGLEGIVAKDLSSPYIAGARKFAWIKLKRSYEGKLADTLDLVVVGYYLGKGKRTQFGFGGLLCAVYSPKTNGFKTVAKVGTGFTEEQMRWFKKNLDKIKIPKKAEEVEALLDADVWVKPKLVVTIKADEITVSPTHTCCRTEKGGLALRFPRLVQIREDKRAEDATTEKEVKEMFEMQGKSESEKSS